MPVSLYQRNAMAVAIATCFPLAAQANTVARVDFASGNVTAVGADGRSRALSKGSEIEVGETVATQAGRAQLRFSDGAYMSLQPQTEFKVEEFKFAGKADGSENIVMNLLKGGMRTITGLIGRTNRNAYRLKTDVATIGIRGTEYSVRYTNSIELFVTDGAISVDNQSGSFVVPGGTGVMVSNQNTPPQQTDQKPVLPPESPSQQQQEEVTKKAPDPVNPIQESAPPPVPAATILTGTLNLDMAFAVDTCNDACHEPVLKLDHLGTLNAAGQLVSFRDGSVDVVPGSGTTVVSLGNDGIIAWGRWENGTISTGSGDLSDPLTLDGNPLHYVVGMPATNLPAGPAFYNMIGHSATCMGGGCTTAAVNSSTLSVNFTTPSITLALQLAINGGFAGTYNFAQSSGIMTAGNRAFIVDGTFPSAFCGSDFFALGFFAGDGAVRAGMGFHASFFSGGPDVLGVVAYRKQ